MTTVLTPPALNRALLARQQLLRRAETPVPETLHRLVGLQAQLPSAPYVGLWSRVAGFTADRLAGPMADRTVLRITAMRGTIHTLTAADCLDLRPRLRPVLDRFLRTLRARLDGLDLDQVTAAARELVEQQPRTYHELGRALADRWPGYDPAALGHVARCRLALVQVTPRGLWGRGGRAAHTTAEHWLGAPLGTGTGPEPLVLRYLAAFGPATAADVQTWSGLTGLRAVLDRLRPRLVTFRSTDGAELFDLPDAPRPAADTAAPVRFLPPLDNLLLSHADRSRVIPAPYRHHLQSPNGLLPGVLLLAGMVRGSWTDDTGRDGARLTVTPFKALSARDTTAVTAEGRRLLAFLSPESGSREVRIAPVP
ncbi:winged helix DNA-binding domain-containing protein [Actinocatenispora thailandica]|uniref:winged helix DNA-binding domain-containing protein n=1 Tax=Actinocatenispora thailandica TaxID=227318 RepID=UPI00194DE232|nr:winged helix DNA-binding domain-containing protein [Actinocatenispora thailandica]